MIADDVNDRASRAPRVMQISKSIRESRAEMQQCARRLSCHACIAIGSAGRYTFLKRQHWAHGRNLVQRRDELHLGRPRITKTHIDTASYERPDETFCTIHIVPLTG
jgi:hypothetical protein